MGSGITSHGIRDHSHGISDHKPRDQGSQPRDQGSQATGSGISSFLRDQGSGCTIFEGSETKNCHAFGIKDQKFGFKNLISDEKHASLRHWILAQFGPAIIIIIIIIIIIVFI